MSTETATVTESNRIYLTNLSYRTSWQDLKDFVRENVAEVTYVDVPMSQGRSRGVAIVEFATNEEAAKAIEVLNGASLGGRDLAVRYDQKPSKRAESQRQAQQGEPDTTVFISGLPWSITWQDLKDLCREYGEVQHADVFKQNQRSKGCGIIRFATTEAAAAAIEALNGTKLRDREITLRIFEIKADEKSA